MANMSEDDMDFMSSSSNALWDPVNSKDWDKENVTPQCVLRIKRWVNLRIIAVVLRSFKNVPFGKIRHGVCYTRTINASILPQRPCVVYITRLSCSENYSHYRRGGHFLTVLNSARV